MPSSKPTKNEDFYFPIINYLFLYFLKKNPFVLDLQRSKRVVAQPGSAHVWGAWGRKFESCLPDKKCKKFIEACKWDYLRAFLLG